MNIAQIMIHEFIVDQPNSYLATGQKTKNSEPTHLWLMTYNLIFFMAWLLKGGSETSLEKDFFKQIRITQDADFLVTSSMMFEYF